MTYKSYTIEQCVLLAKKLLETEGDRDEARKTISLLEQGMSALKYKVSEREADSTDILDVCRSEYRHAKI
jgi:hypothetical protein